MADVNRWNVCFCQHDREVFVAQSFTCHLFGSGASDLGLSEGLIRRRHGNSSRIRKGQAIPVPDAEEETIAAEHLKLDGNALGSGKNRATFRSVEQLDYRHRRIITNAVPTLEYA